MDPPRQFKQRSRKGKKAWRKNVDLTSVESGLDNVRDEIIQGGVVAEKPSDELFALDTTGDKAIQKAYAKVHKPLKADEIIARRSTVPAVDSKKRPASRTTDGVLEPALKKRRAGALSRKEVQRLKDIASSRRNASIPVTQASDHPDHDPWAESSDVAKNDKYSKFSYLEAPKPITKPSTLQEAPISLLANGKVVPAIKKPLPETSYNPHSTEYFAAFMRAGEQEIEAERKRVKNAEAQREKDERAAAIAAEVSEASGSEDDESTWEGIESDTEGVEWLTRTRPERKTQAQRNRIKRRKEKEQKERWELQMKRKAHQVAEVKRIAAAVEAKELARRQALTRASDNDEEDSTVDDTNLRRKPFGRVAVPPTPLELVLPSELQDSLRLLKPEGNLLTERFRSIMVRGKLETRRPISQPKKARRMYTEKWSYKDWKLKSSV
ncbi:MAG: hypothetical protein M1825_004375 [Sarcosagium campestre]|nr:MAG: hypothetical protein M1825_004375 [Sarcosagium campestre]